MHSSERLQHAHRDYLESRTLSAQPVVIIQMLYSVAIDSLGVAMDKLASGDALGRAREVSRAQEAVAELMVSLDHSAGAPFSQELGRLYAYAQAEMLRGHVNRSLEAFRNARSVLNTLSEGWAGVCEQITANQDHTAEIHAEIEKAASGVDVTSLVARYQPPAGGCESRYWSC